MSKSLRSRHMAARLFEWSCLAAALVSVSLLVILLGSVAYRGLPHLNWNFLTSFPSRIPERAGIKSALWGSVWLIGLTTLMAVPIGVGTAICLEEYGRRSWWRKIIEINISNLAGVPSIVYGILGLGLFVRALSLERSVLAGALTMTLVVLPIVIISSQQALRAVPDSIRHASYALGATRWQTVWHQTLPAALPGLLTGIVLAVSRAMGEAAPLIMIGALTYVPFVPTGLNDSFTTLPIQAFNWSSRPQEAFRDLAAGAIVVLLVLVLLFNAGAVVIRQRSARTNQW